MFGGQATLLATCTKFPIKCVSYVHFRGPKFEMLGLQRWWKRLQLVMVVGLLGQLQHIACSIDSAKLCHVHENIYLEMFSLMQLCLGCTGTQFALYQCYGDAYEVDPKLSGGFELNPTSFQNLL